MDGNTDTTLKPCPFCGSEPVMRRGGRYGFWALCQHCGAALRMSDTEEDAANAWNRRAASAALSSPARNCDRYGDEDDAFAAWHDALNDGDVVSVRNAFAWLFAKAEGGAE